MRKWIVVVAGCSVPGALMAADKPLWGEGSELGFGVSLGEALAWCSTLRDVFILAAALGLGALGLAYVVRMIRAGLKR